MHAMSSTQISHSSEYQAGVGLHYEISLGQMFDERPCCQDGGQDDVRQSGLEILPCSFLAVRMMQPVASATRHSAMVAGFVLGRDGRCSTSFWLRTCNDGPSVRFAPLHAVSLS